jgi:hypothetical protein
MTFRGASAAVALAALACAHAASAGPASAGYNPRTAWGAPDLEGAWSNLSLTRLERPPGVEKLAVRGEEAAAVERRMADVFLHEDAEVGQRDTEWQENFPLARIDGSARTSWIVSPADGRVPYTNEAKARRAMQANRETGLDGPEARPGNERCLMSTSAGPPLLNANSDSDYQIIQTQREVVIIAQMNHDARIVRLNGRHPPDSVRLWMGDSIGHWDRDTLVVETTNFHPSEGGRSRFLMSPQAKIVERFRRVSPSELRYEFSVEDPATFTEIWRGQIPLRAIKGPIYEFACHEGNYSLPNILGGARREEADALAAVEGAARSPAAP